MNALDALHPITAAWFTRRFGAPTPVQEGAFPAIRSLEDCLLLAPTGSGKTLAAFLVALDRLTFEVDPRERPRCRLVYVSPLKALAVDVEKNLRAPLLGLSDAARSAGVRHREPSVHVRTGDTDSKLREAFRRSPADVLVTTPESLFLLVTSSAREALSQVEAIIVDEIHSMLPTKRGAHLALTVERLAALRGASAPPLQRIGLSATQRPIDEAARLLGGHANGERRPVKIVDARVARRIDVTVEVPVPDMSDLADEAREPGATGARGMWPAIHQRLLAHVRAHRSTMIFVNARRLAERLAAALNDLAGAPIAAAHHGSLAREQREIIEERLKSGDLPCIIATSTLELGIDMGAVDLVVALEAPPSISSGVQRIGRACHEVGGVPRGILVPKHRGDLLACAAASQGIREIDVEPTKIPLCPLDVLAQQVVAIVASARDPLPVDALLALVQRAAPFSELSRQVLDDVLDMLSGRYPSEDFAGLRPRVTWDRAADALTPREGALRLVVVNAGTIPDRGLFGVFLSGDGERARRVGELDEEMVFESKPGDVFVLGSTSWRIDDITQDRVLVSPAPGEPGRLPFWKGDNVGRSAVFGARLGALTREIATAKADDARARLRRELGLDAWAADNAVGYVEAELTATGHVPCDRQLVVERFRDELGDLRVALLSPFGGRVHAAWGTALGHRFRAERSMSVDITWSDDGVAMRFPDADAAPDTASFFFDPSEIEPLLVRALTTSRVFAARFREAAGRALLLPRKYPGQRTPLFRQRRRAADLLTVASRYPGFPIVLEALRECLSEVFDLPGFTALSHGVAAQTVRVVDVTTQRPSPFASALLFSFVGELMYEADQPLAQLRAQALRIDPEKLRELMGGVSLRELFDPEVIEEIEASLAPRAAATVDGLHDLLLSHGDLAARDVDPGLAARLVDAGRALAVTIAGEARLIAIEDASRYRDAVGVSLPKGLPAVWRAPTEAPLAFLVSRHARHRGPFTEADVVAHFGLSRESARHALDELVARGRLVEGELRPGGTGVDLCDAEIVRRIRQRTLARLRASIEPVDAPTYARFVAAHQMLGRQQGPGALTRVVEQLEGAPLVASALEAGVLTARIPGYTTADLDLLLASGSVMWVGLSALGVDDGEIALVTVERAHQLLRPPRPTTHVLADRVRAALEAGGALFFPDLARRVGAFPNDVAAALWDLIWAGEVTNDTLMPLRSYLAGDLDRTTRAPRGTEGRFWLVTSRVPALASPTERAAATTWSLLQRHGVVTRATHEREGVPGGFSALYPVMKELESRGRLRRGYFVAGGGGLQFALPHADEALQKEREAPTASTFWLDATDPANPYGASLPWPTTDQHVARVAGATVLLVNGAALAYLGRGKRSLTTFLPAEVDARADGGRAIAGELAGLCDRGPLRALLITSIDGASPRASALWPFLLDAGFVGGADGVQRTKRRPS